MSKHKNFIEDLSNLKRSKETILQDEEKVNQTLKWLKELLRSRDDLFAICAPQIGVDQRIICIKFANEDIRTFINPLLQKVEGVHLSRETEICIPGKEFLVPRFDVIDVTYQDVDGKISTITLNKTAGEVMQQMIQFLDGITLADWGLEIIPEFDEASEEDKLEVINLYLEGLSVINDSLKKKAETDSDFKELYDATKFLNYKLNEVENENPLLMTQTNYKQRRDLKKFEKKLKKVKK